MSVYSWDTNTKLCWGQTLWAQVGFLIATVLKFLSPKCCDSVCFVFRSFAWRAWKIIVLPPSSETWKKKILLFQKNKIIGHCNENTLLGDYGECTDGCAYWVNTCLWTKKKHLKVKKKKKKKTYFWHNLKISKHRIVKYNKNERFERHHAGRKLW